MECLKERDKKIRSELIYLRKLCVVNDLCGNLIFYDYFLIYLDVIMFEVIEDFVVLLKFYFILILG